MGALQKRFWRRNGTWLDVDSCMAHGMKRDDGLSLVYVKERTISKFLQTHDKDEVRWWINQGFLVARP